MRSQNHYHLTLLASPIVPLLPSPIISIRAAIKIAPDSVQMSLIGNSVAQEVGRGPAEGVFSAIGTVTIPTVGAAPARYGLPGFFHTHV